MSVVGEYLIQNVKRLRVRVTQDTVFKHEVPLNTSISAIYAVFV